MVEKTFDFKVNLRTELKKSIPCDYLQSRNAMGMIFCFLGYA